MSFDEAQVAQAMDALLDHYLADACPCRYPRFRAVVKLDTWNTAGGSFYTRERQLLILGYEKKVPLVGKRPLPPWTEFVPQMWQAECGVCGSTVSRSSSETGAVDYLVFERPKGLVDVGAQLVDGKILRVGPFVPGGPNMQGAGKAAMIYPIVPLDEFVRWMRERAPTAGAVTSR